MDKGTLKEIISLTAKQYNFRSEIVEKDYYLTVILNSIESHLSKNLVFKGGTLLNKIHLNHHRLSEDLDFTYYGKEELNSRSKRSKAIKPVRENMPGFLEHLGLKSEKPKGEGYKGDFKHNFGLSEKAKEDLYKQIETDLMPVIRLGKHFDFGKVFERFNEILK